MVERQFFLGFVKIHILYHASKEPVSGVDLATELSRHGYSLSPGTLYPTLHRLERDGFLERGSMIVEGKVRKYYTITRSGRDVLREARKKVSELTEEVLEEGDRP